MHVQVVVVQKRQIFSINRYPINYVYFFVVEVKVVAQRNVLAYVKRINQDAHENSKVVRQP